MPAVAWTIQIGSGAPVTFASRGYSGITRTCRSGMEDTVTIRHDGHQVDYDTDIGYGAAVTIYRDGVRWFHGRCNTPAVTGDGSAEGHTYEIVGPWWWLEQIVYQQDWTLWDPSYGGGAGALITKKKSRVILFQQADGTAINSGVQASDILTYAAGLGAPIATGAIDLDVNLPMEEVLDISCAEALRRCMRWSPECVAWWDYSTATPTLHIRKPASLGTLSYNIATDAARQAIQIRPRYDLQVPGITIHYERTDTVDGVGYETFFDESAGTTTDPRSVVATIELAGSNKAYLRQRIETEDWPTAGLNDKTWWKSHHPALKETLDIDLTITDAKIQETGGAPSGLYPRVLLEGQMQDWMDVEYTTYNVVATVSVVKKVAGVIVKQEKNQQLTFTVVATDAETKTYSRLADYESAEDTPAGLASKFYASWGRLHYEGTWAVVSEDVPAGTLMGNVINLTGGAGAWAAMNAVIYEVVQDIDNGVTQIRFGPNRYLGLNDLLALLRTLRHRRTAIRHKARVTGESADKDVGMDAAGPVAKNDADTGYSEVLSQYMTSDETSESTVRKIELAPNDIDDTTGAASLTVKAREVGILDPSTLQWKKRQVLCSEPYGSALGSISAAITVITAIQYDTSSHELQYKTRSVKVIDVGSESSWTTWHTAAACPT